MDAQADTSVSGDFPKGAYWPSGGSGIGDINSAAVGSGARKNGGKPDYGLLPLSLIFTRMDITDMTGSATGTSRSPTLCLGYLAKWQSSGTLQFLVDALRESASGGSRYWKLDMFRDAADVLAYGKGKYAPWNWAKGMPMSVPFACAIRHLIALINDEKTDPESGCSHWGHVQANLLMLLLFDAQYPDLNDMPFAVLKSPCGI